MPLRDAFAAWRNRVVANPKFQRWAAAFPLTRFIANAQARGLFDLCAGFVYSQVLHACIELDVFKILAQGPLPLEAVAPLLKLAPDRAARLLDAAVSLKLLTRRRDGAYRLAMRGAALLGNPGVAAMVRHHRVLYADLADPVKLLRGEGGGALAHFWAYARADDPAALKGEAVADYSALMASSQALIADDILDAWPMTAHSRLLDVGGGEGVFLTAAGKRNPQLQLQLFDLPAVAARAQAHFAASGLAERATCASGDFRRDPLPQGADLISLVRILHDHDDDAALDLLRNIRRAIPAHGALIIAEPLAGTRGAEPVGGAYFAFYLLAMGSGKARSFAEISHLLQGAGFAGARQIATRRPMLTGLIAAVPAGAAGVVAPAVRSA